MAISKTKVKERLESVVNGLSVNKLFQLIDFAEYLISREKRDITQELMSDDGISQDMDEGREQAKRREGKSWRDV